MLGKNIPVEQKEYLSTFFNEELKEKLIACNEACKTIICVYEKVDEFWKNKASFFTLCYVLTMERTQRSPEEIADMLDAFQHSSSPDWQQYYEASNQGVNDKKVRELRASILKRILK